MGLIENRSSSIIHIRILERSTKEKSDATRRLSDEAYNMAQAAAAGQEAQAAVDINLRL